MSSYNVSLAFDVLPSPGELTGGVAMEKKVQTEAVKFPCKATIRLPVEMEDVDRLHMLVSDGEPVVVLGRVSNLPHTLLVRKGDGRYVVVDDVKRVKLV